MKKRLFLISVLVLVILLSGCYTPQPRTIPFTIDVKVDKPIYRIGGKIFITVRASQTCYLSLYDISTEGEVTQIFPNKFALDNLIQGGQIYRIPATSDTFDFEVTGPPGIERIRAIGTIKNVNFFNQSKATSDEVFPRIHKAPDQFDQALNQKLQVIPTGQWAEASVTFQIQ